MRPGFEGALGMAFLGDSVDGHFLEPLALDNIRWHLVVTGIGAALLGLGASRTKLGRSRFDST